MRGKPHNVRSLVMLLEIKEISTIQENDFTKTRLLVSDSVTEREIILEGKGMLKSAVAEV